MRRAFKQQLSDAIARMHTYYTVSTLYVESAFLNKQGVKDPWSNIIDLLACKSPHIHCLLLKAVKGMHGATA